MNKRYPLIYLGLFATAYSGIAISINCDQPCGPEEVLYCIGQAQTLLLTPKQVYTMKLFDPKNADQFCAKCSKVPLPPEGPTYTTNPLQAQYCANFCQTAKGSYFSYENFLAAYADMQKNGSDFSIACNGTVEERKKELANLLATSAQETTSALSGYTTDGLYYRYENGALVTKDPVTQQPKPCMDFNCVTPYAGLTAAIVVATNTNDDIFTEYYWNAATITDGKVTGNRITLTGSGPMQWKWDQSAPPPQGYTLKTLRDAVQPGYWVGMGNLQLTADTMMGFFGWYNNHIAKTAQKHANLQSFIQRYLVDGKLGFIGGFWYWNYRTNGSGYPSIHQVVTSGDPVCQDIALVTVMVNGGCNDYNIRKEYYQYFGENVSGLKLKASCITTSGAPIDCNDTTKVDLNSMQCANPARFQTYCYSKIPQP